MVSGVKFRVRTEEQVVALVRIDGSIVSVAGVRITVRGASL